MCARWHAVVLALQDRMHRREEYLTMVGKELTRGSLGKTFDTMFTFVVASSG